jgi:hypothetical protein
MSFNNRLICGALAFTAFYVAVSKPSHAVVANIALGKPTTTSSVDFGGIPANGVDGNINTITHSANTGANFWQVDLTAPSELLSIELVNRADGCCPERLNGAVLSVLDSTLTPIFTAAPFAGAGVAQVFTFDNGGAGFSGAQFVRVDHNGNWLAIAELRAFSDVTFGNLANLFGTASQSTTGFGLPATGAIDGNRIGGSISHTDSGDMTPNLSVDLGNLYRMETIDIYTRDNCCTATDPERDYNLTLEILDAEGNVVYTHPVYNPWDGIDPPASAPVVGLGASFSIDLPGAGVVGKSVRVSKIAHGGFEHSEWLSIAELEVYGSTAAVPEPSSVCLAALGLIGGVFAYRRRHLK